ncbi:hypothetical protein CAPTEDRAFT_225131 [Capitella teleta]|uniref:G-protein coupled receptors family 2 profile 2 domain-containing protein n=1 Tax=Capitella teleta TaxID=283909 RepID=R7TT52_CAPTE|nr:hypothetical protein CAPTEDRAFT_225131 [Capitella teleta]|eukprot:ELT96794.1 hypothetical protein CAPTEDRAFT_225131 [Capitella teleta]
MKCIRTVAPLFWVVILCGQGVFRSHQTEEYSGSEQNVVSVCGTVNSKPLCQCDATNGRETRVDCSNIEISEIPPGIPASTAILYIDENNIRHIEEGAFQNLFRLELLQMQDNAVTGLTPESLQYLTGLQEIDLSVTLLQCDCSTLELRRRSRFYEQQIHGIICENFEMDLFDVPADMFGDCPELDIPFCHYCNNSENLQDCLKFGQRVQCSSPHDVCLTKFTAGPGRGPSVTMKCVGRLECPDYQYDNPRTCLENRDSIECNFCCAANDCNHQMDNSGYFYTAYFELTFGVNNWSLDGGSDIYITAVINNLTEATFGSINFDVTPGLVDLGFNQKGEMQFYVTIEVRLELGSNVKEVNEELYSSLLEASRRQPLSDVIVNGSISLRPTSYENKCSSETTQTSRGTFSWPSVSPGDEIVNIRCPVPRLYAYKSVAQRACVTSPSGLAIWTTPDVSACAVMTDSIEELMQLNEMDITADTIVDVSEKLAMVTRRSPDFTEDDFDVSVSVLGHLITPDDPMNTASSLNYIVETYNNLMDVEFVVLEGSEAASSSATKALQDLENLSSSLTEDPNEILMVKEKIAVVVRGLDGVDNSAPVVCSAFMSSDGMLEPSSAIRAVQASVNEIGSDLDAEGSKELNSRIIAASFNGDEMKALETPIEITLTHNLKDIYGQSLSEKNKEALMWISYLGCGLSLIGVLFTIVTYLHFKQLRRDKPSIILINLCFALMLLLISFVLSTLKIIRNVDIACKEDLFIIQNLKVYLTWTSSHLDLYISDRVRHNIPSDMYRRCSPARVIAVILHYSIMATWAWMFVEAYYMYIALISIMPKYYSHMVLKMSLFGWGTPLIPVAIVLGLSREHYGLQQDICWLDQIPFYAGCLAPIAFVLLINITMFILVIRQLHNFSVRRNIEKTVYSSVRVRLKGGIGVMFLVGLTWVFAIFAVGGVAGLIFNYLFTVCNTLQGLFVFLFNCLGKNDARKAWWRSITRESSSSSTSSKTKTSTAPSPENVDNRNMRPYTANDRPSNGMSAPTKSSSSSSS